MKRTPMVRRTPLARETAVLKRTALPRATKPIRTRSLRRERTYAGPGGRRRFVADTLAARPSCEVRSEVCTGAAVDVHESILRSRGGAIVPGPLADAQGQRFFAICRSCHTYTHAHRAWAEVRGFLDARHAWEIGRAA